MSRAATHNGTCQSCGREQADTRSGLAKHGYSVEWGFFSGVCSGAHHQPLELDRSRLDWTCEQLAENAARLEAMTLADIETVQIREWNEQGGKYKNGGYEMNPYTADEFQGKQTSDYYGTPEEKWAKQQEIQLSRIHSQAKSQRHHAEMLKDLADKVHGQPLKGRGKKAPPPDRCPGSGLPPADDSRSMYRPCSVCGFAFGTSGQPRKIRAHKIPK